MTLDRSWPGLIFDMPGDHMQIKLLDNISDCRRVDFCGTSCTLYMLAVHGCELHEISIHLWLEIMQLNDVVLFRYQQCPEESFIGNEPQLKSGVVPDQEAVYLDAGVKRKSH